ncbi:MAG: hypothetical protein GX363_02575 [Clostridiales bacterium]|nr:hypothetical protein [Clostridiales bacterium]
MQPLITIENVPISIEYVESDAPKKVNVQSATSLSISRHRDMTTIKSNPINIPFKDSFVSTAKKHKNIFSYTATASYTENGKLKVNVQMDEETSEFLFMQFNRGIDNMIGLLPQTQAEKPPSYFQIDFDISHLPTELVAPDVDTSFTPPDLEIRVVEYPKVIIKYIGGPIYIPRSAGPNYEEPQKANLIFDGEPNFDVKA